MVLSEFLGAAALAVSLLIGCVPITAIAFLRRSAVEALLEHTPTSAIPVSCLEMSQAVADAVEAKTEPQST